MRQGKLVVSLSVLAVLVLVVVACAPAATPTPTPTPVVATPTPEVQPQYGGTLYWDLATVTHFDAQRSVSVTVNSAANLVFSQLVRFDPFINLNFYDPKYIVGDLAERWEVSPDGKLYTFYLRPRVKFHDGRSSTAKDVKYSLEKLMDPTRSVFSTEFSVIDRVEIVDDYTVKVYLKYPHGYFLPLLAQGMSHIQPEHLKAVSYRTPPFAIGTGPFKLVSYTVGVEQVFERNPDYHHKGRPYLDGIKHVRIDWAAAISAFIGRRLDIGMGYGVSQTKEDIETVKRLASEAVFVWQPGNYPVVRGATFNFAREGPWQDVRVRRAMVLTSDFRGATLAASGGQPEMGSHEAGYFYSAPGGYGLPWSEYEKAWLLNRPEAERVTEAKRLMAQVGYPNGFKGEYIVAAAGGSSYINPSLLHLDLWKRYLNIDLTFAALDTAASTSRTNAGDFDIHFSGYTSTLLEPEQVLASYYFSGGDSNSGRYSHPKIDEIYQQMRAERDLARRVELTHQAERLLIQDIPKIPWYRGGRGFTMWPYVKGWIFHPFQTTYNGTPEGLWFDTTDPTWSKRAVGK